MQYHAYSFYTHSNSILAKGVLAKTYGSLKYDGTQVTHSGLILESDKSMITPNSLVIESTLKYGGVKFTTLKSIIKRNANLSVTQFDCPITLTQCDKIITTAQELEGLPYDVKGVLGMALEEDWQETDMFCCSELEAYLLYSAWFEGVDWSKYNIGRISPREVRSWPQTKLILPFLT